MAIQWPDSSDNGLDFRKKLSNHKQQSGFSGEKDRMNFNERIQHFVLLITFAILAYTGFALKFPTSWLSHPFMGHDEWRSLGHRAAAFVFTLWALYHVWFLIFTPRGRKKWKAYQLKGLDFQQFVQMVSFNLGFSKKRPVLGYHNYVNKLEYWALLWGTVIMIVTGVLLMQDNWLLRVFPKWSYDLISIIHYYEAVLACLAVLVWHG